MNDQDKKINRFIDDAIFLEWNRQRIKQELEALNNKTEEESKRSQYTLPEKPMFRNIIVIFFAYAIIMLLVHFIIVPLLHFIIIDLVISIFQGFRTMPPYRTFDIVCDIVVGILLFIPVLMLFIEFIGDRVTAKKEYREKSIHDENEERRLQHFYNVTLPKIKDEENELNKEYATYDSEIRQLYGLGIFPIEYCNLESMCVMQEYISKYKVTEKKKLLNACDKYFQYKDLKQDAEKAQERLEEAQMRIIDSFEDMAYSMESQIDSIMMKVESQNYDLESLQERTEREKRNSELLLYWNLID